jgi:hypothetical protein
VRKATAIALVLAFAPAVVSHSAPIAISPTVPLSFGRVMANGGGTVTVTPLGQRVPLGGVFLLPSSSGVAAQFLVTGDALSNYSITLPSDGVVFLTNESSNTMAVNGFTSLPLAAGVLATGNQVLSVGATLSVGANQAAGNYSGSFNVTVVYN